MQPLSWNASFQYLGRGQRRADVRGKWVNWKDQSGWQSIDARFREDSGMFSASNIPAVFLAPAIATNTAILSVEQAFDIFEKSEIKDSPLVLEFTPVGVRPVGGHINPDSPSQVVYPDAWGDGIDLRYTIWHGKSPRATKEIVIRKMPPGTGDLEYSFVVRSSGVSIRKKGNKKPITGTPESVKNKGLIIRQSGKSDDPSTRMRGAGIKRPVVWYYSPNGKLVRTNITLKVHKVSRSETILTKVVPRSLVAAALSAGCPLMSDTTTTFYPDPDTETSSVDGKTSHASVGGEDWSDLRTYPATLSEDSNATDYGSQIEAHASTSDKWITHTRSHYSFDTTSIGAGATITSGTFSVMPTADARTDDVSSDLTIVSSAPASETALVDGDHDNIGTTELVDVALSIGSMSDDVYEDFVLNSAGVSHLSGIDQSRFCLADSFYDVQNLSPPTWAASDKSEVVMYFAEQSGTSKDPKLEVVYTPGASESSAAGFMMFV